MNTSARWLVVFAILTLCSGLGEAQNCWTSAKSQVQSDGLTMWHAVLHLPRAIIQPHNLEWELPVAAATGILIEDGDARVASDVRGAHSLNHTSDFASTATVATMLGVPALAYAVGCAGSHTQSLRPEFNVVAAGGFAVLTAEAIKFATWRQRPYVRNATGEFWDGNTSFPSGHTVAAWAVASALSQEYPHRRWVKWSAYGAAIAVSVLRITANQHYPSDVIVGGTLGYLIGSRLAH